MVFDFLFLFFVGFQIVCDGSFRSIGGGREFSRKNIWYKYSALDPEFSWLIRRSSSLNRTDSCVSELKNKDFPVWVVMKNPWQTVIDFYFYFYVWSTNFSLDLIEKSRVNWIGRGSFFLAWCNWSWSRWEAKKKKKKKTDDSRQKSIMMAWLELCVLQAGKKKKRQKENADGYNDDNLTPF